MGCCRIVPFNGSNVAGDGLPDEGTSLELLMCGTDEVAATSDTSIFAHSMVFNNSGGNAVIDTAQFVSGWACSSSLRVDATIDSAMGYVYCADHHSFALGDQDFTLEFFFRHNGASMGTTARYLMGQVDDNAGVLVTTNSSVLIAVSAGKLAANAYRSTVGTSIHNGGAALVGGTALSGNTWYYGAYVRDGDTFRLYLGTPGGSAAQETSVVAVAANAIVQDSSANWGLGICGEWPTLAWYNLNGSPDVSGWSGWIGPTRLTKGICRYPGGTTYTVPTSY